jgi:hypothetical protein
MKGNKKRFRKSTLRELSDTWKRSREYSRGRDGFHEYLDAVYNWFATLRKTPGRATKTRNNIIRWTKGKAINKNTHTFLVIIGASSSESRRMQSRWAQALRYAWKWRHVRKNLTLTEFFKKNGGVAGCARKFSTKRKPTL